MKYTGSFLSLQFFLKLELFYFVADVFKKSGLLTVVTMTILSCPQVYIRILDNEWNVYRRYAEFRELHNHLRTQFPQVDGFNFPPKKAIGNKVSYKPL